ncbi:ABC transporter permease [Candidatus Sumerlaeota bacterium]|nr:ABC transporter permease [Candidatus Sumerlaeota bacterium]
MIAYIIRRVAYAVPILLGVNLLLFLLFFWVNSPDDLAKTALGEKFSNKEQIEIWKQEHGYNLPLFFNAREGSLKLMLTQTIFWQKSMPLFWFNFGKSDMDDSSITGEIWKRIPPSLCITAPTFFFSLAFTIFAAMIVAFYRGTYVDLWALLLCVLMMSISQLFYIIGGQFVIAKWMMLTPVSGWDTGIYSIKFLILPIIVGLISAIGGGIRYNRTIFLEEIGKDYVRTARAKGLGEGTVLYKHALKNAMLPILTSVVVSIPFLIMGSLLIENFFGIPGLGSYTIDAITKQDFSVIRAMVFLGSVLYVSGLIMVDISYTLVDPRIRFE